jgi:hypothetical protein
MKQERLEQIVRQELARLFPSYTTDELKKWLAGNSLDGATRAKVEKEVADRESGASKQRVTPQITPGWKASPKIVGN